MFIKISLFSIFALVAFASCGNSQIEPTIVKPVTKNHNKIDDIKNSQDVTKLLITVDPQLKSFVVTDALSFEDADCNALGISLKAKSWEKADFDGNGYNDLLVNGKVHEDTAIIVVMDLGSEKYDVKFLTRGFFTDCSLAAVREAGTEPIISFSSKKTPNKIENLVLKFGDFIEQNKSSASHKIEKIEYKTTGCFGTCPIFELNIDLDRKASFKSIEFNDKKKKGVYRGIINLNEYNELVDVLNYIDIENLKSDYSVNWTDDQSSTLTITYDGGKVKKIDDYGLIGTFGLSRLYKLLFDLRENQAWK